MSKFPHSRHSRVIVDLDAIRFNYRYLKESAAGSRVIAVVKADAYGHGAVEVARALGDADAFAVATVPEAYILRQAGIRQKILVLGGVVNAEEMNCCFDNGLDPVVHQFWQIDLLDQGGEGRSIDAWVKFNSGMGRLGFSREDFKAALQRLEDHPRTGLIRLMTHLANADDVEDPKSNSQIDQVTSLGLDEYEWGIANSAGILGWSSSQRHWVRSGIALYGSDPLVEPRHAGKLRPAMTFKSELLAINRQKKGQTVGYGALYTCPEDRQIGVVAAGYADGYPRHLMDGHVTVNGQRAPIVGRVSMDMLTIDVTGLDASPGDEVVLWGNDPLAADIARQSETIAYELLCHAGCHGKREYLGQS